MSAIDTSARKNWLDATYGEQSFNVLLDPGSIPASFVNAAFAAKLGLKFHQLETPKRIRYPTGEEVFSF